MHSTLAVADPASSRLRSLSRVFALLALSGALALLLASSASARASVSSPRGRPHAHSSKKAKHKPTALLVGEYNGHKGNYKTVRKRLMQRTKATGS